MFVISQQHMSQLQKVVSFLYWTFFLYLLQLPTFLELRYVSLRYDKRQKFVPLSPIWQLLVQYFWFSLFQFPSWMLSWGHHSSTSTTGLQILVSRYPRISQVSYLRVGRLECLSNNCRKVCLNLSSSYITNFLILCREVPYPKIDGQLWSQLCVVINYFELIPIFNFVANSYFENYLSLYLMTRNFIRMLTWHCNSVTVL